MSGFSADDHRHMARALQLAARGLTTTTPNPRVGCVIVRDGCIVGEGWHQRAGEPHAEVYALRQAGALARGATAYVTLEPCAHFGRTPPCADGLVEAGVGRVVAAMTDPNPRVDGGGFAKLRAAGIQAEAGLLEAEARELNIGFISRMTRGRPWVRLKVAASLDGKTALNNGLSQWITGPEARLDGHRWRARACAILTGYGTVRDDDPQLTVRGLEVSRQPLRIVVDSRLETSPGAKIVGPGTLMVAAARHPDIEARANALEAAGAEVIWQPQSLARGEPKVDLPGLMQTLGARGINELHVEAGFKLNGSLLRESCVDELLVYQAPVLLGDQARGMFDLPALTDLKGKTRLQVLDRRILGPDQRWLARLLPIEATS